MSPVLKFSLAIGMMAACIGCASQSVPETSEEDPTSRPDLVAPILLTSEPSGGATQVPVESQLTLVFSEVIDPSSVNSESLRVTRDSYPVSGKVFHQGERIFFSPDPLWDFNGDYEVNLSSQITDLAGNALQETASIRFSVEPFDTNLPIVLIDTLGQTIPDDPKVAADMKIIEDPLGGRNALGDSATAYDGKIGIEIRGSTSQLYPKKQYGFETWDDAGDEIDVALLGFPAESDWIWQANYADKTFLRNAIPSELSNEIGRYASRTKFVELFLREGEGPAGYHYWGLYLLMEKIKRDSNRVNITKLRPTDNQEPAISGGYILALDIVKPGDGYFYTDRGTQLLFVDPKGEDLTTLQRAWTRNYMNQFESTLYGPNFKDPVEGYAKYIDVDCFVDFLLINEIFKNLDAFAASTYMHKDREKKLCLGPIWDFIPSWGSADPSQEFRIEGWGLLDSIWIKRLMQDPAFRLRFEDRYHELRQGVFHLEHLLDLLDERVHQIEEAQARNFLRWPILGVSIGTGEPIAYPRTYAEEIEFLKSWIERRLEWMDAHIDSLI